MVYIAFGLIYLIVSVVVLVKFFQIAADVRKMRTLLEKKYDDTVRKMRTLLEKKYDDTEKVDTEKVAPASIAFDNHELVISKIDTEDVKAGEVIEVGDFVNGKYICYRNYMKVGAFSPDEIVKREKE